MRRTTLAVIVALTAVIYLLLPLVIAVPDGVTIIPIRNETKTPGSGGIINTTGGSITTVNINGTTQNVRWKAFIGNVSGRLTLDDASGATIFDWSANSIAGEIYTTRFVGSINWTGINCSNATNLINEDIALLHTSPDDNISATFSETTHDGFFVGTFQIAANSCRSIHIL